MYDHQRRHGDAQPLVQRLARHLIRHQAQQQRGQRGVNDPLSAHCRASTQARSSSSLTLPPKRLPSSQVAPLASFSMFFPLLPMPLLDDVQNGIIILPEKS